MTGASHLGVAVTASVTRSGAGIGVACSGSHAGSEEAGTLGAVDGGADAENRVSRTARRRPRSFTSEESAASFSVGRPSGLSLLLIAQPARAPAAAPMIHRSWPIVAPPISPITKPKPTIHMEPPRRLDVLAGASSKRHASSNYTHVQLGTAAKPSVQTG